MTEDVGLHVVAPDDAVVESLRVAQQDEITAIFGEGDPVGPLPGDAMLVAVLLTVDGEPAGCVSVRASEYHGPRDAELKRLFVRPAYRGRGLSRLLVAEAERLAVHHGFDRMVLETGDLLVEAVALYRSLGYAPIPRYGPYVEYEDSLCFARDLVDRAAVRRRAV